MESTLPISKTTGGLSLIAAPLVFATSTFFWKEGQYGVTGGTLINLSQVPWIISFIVLFDKLKMEVPRYATVGLIIAIYGCLSGANFGFVGVFGEAFQIPHKTYLETFLHYPLSANLLLFWPGPLFPLSLLVLGIVLIRRKKVDLWLGILLCLGAIAFPLSRIPRIESVAHAVDILLAIPLVIIGYKELVTSKLESLSL
ncbi:hypothetical protein SAMN04488109_0960 [Chryseolinea serpens]|uniref:Uncharacterized protein n=1 Tax=Chryseolinea serpens TaxID=947013 RepID=A0A1M5L1T7_9BACT|nr:hypothetical protein [Chryseolinea serpens]SHG58890.1 hypothetical protein SAMN04488109_0960 [Chryseolinea serpens]